LWNEAGYLAVAAFIVPTEAPGYDVFVHEVLDATEKDVVLGNVERFSFDLDSHQSGKGLVDGKVPLRHVNFLQDTLSRLPGDGTTHPK
jgi:hypothetical protein